MKDKIFYLIFFGIILGFMRLIPHPPNFTPIIASAIVAPMFLHNRLFGLIIPIMAMFITDIIIGFHSYQIVIYLTLATISLMSPLKKNYTQLALFAIFSSVWFFLVTNFAVWIAWDYYPKNWEGLVLCYTLAIPFFKNTIISTCLFTGLLTIIFKHIEAVNEKTNHLVFNIFNKN